MAYFIFARDGTSRIVLKRDSRDAAEKKARELKDLGWFDVQIEEADSSKAAWLPSPRATLLPSGSQSS